MKDSHDVTKKGYHRKDFGPDNKMNHRIEDAYAPKDESPSRKEKTGVHDIAKHQQHSKIMSDKMGEMKEKD